MKMWQDLNTPKVADATVNRQHGHQQLSAGTAAGQFSALRLFCFYLDSALISARGELAPPDRQSDRLS